jgi:hypothetical protein
MAQSKTTSTRTGVVFLMLFALPFAAVGVGALGWGVWSLAEWQKTRNWIAVPAQLLTVDLEEHRGDDSTTYEATATYRYEYGGREYQGSRVAIDSGADNIGEFHRSLYNRLRYAHERGVGVEAFVNPGDPAQAVLDRELRWGMLLFKGMFGLVFGGVGFGLLFGARYGGKKLAAEEKLRARHPDEPWRWRADWASGRIAGSTHTAAYVAIGFAVLWNLVSLPAAVFVPHEIASGNQIAAIALLFPLIGVGLAAWAIRAWLRLKRFKVATLTLARTPAVLGGRLRGSIRVEAEVPVTADFRLELSCSEERVSGSGKNRERSERLVWQKEWRVPRHQCQVSSMLTSIPVDVLLPADQPATTMGDDTPKFSWRLDVTGECPGPDFWSRFELPVFALGAAGTAADADADAGVGAPAPPAPQRPDERALASLGIAYERSAHGGEAWTFRRAQHKKLALGITAFALGWGAAAAALFASDAPLVIPIVFSLFDVLFVWWALSLWLTEYRVTLERGLLTLTRSGFMARAPIEVPQQWIRRIYAKRGMQAGNKLYYDLRVETTEGTHTAASSLADYDVATWLARHWGAGAADPARR